jgi:CubicO group peptidase (beta-lactamase class C family)
MIESVWRSPNSRFASDGSLAPHPVIRLPSHRSTQQTPRSDSELIVFDDAADSQWTRRPAFPDAHGGMVSTAADLLRFAAALLDEGAGVIASTSVRAMTRDQLTAEQREASPTRPFLDRSGGATAWR